MICAACFAENAESATVCANCGRALPQLVAEPEHSQDPAELTAAGAGRMPAAVEPERPRNEAPVFRDPLTLQKWVFGLLCGLGGLAVLSIILDVAQIRLLDAIEAGSFASQEDLIQAAEASDSRQQVVGWAYIAAFAATLAVFGKWIYRVAQNARAISPEEFRTSPGMAVGSYFIPIINWRIPYMAMSEIWRASRNPVGWRDQPAGAFLGWWWAVWIVSNLAGNVTWRYVTSAETLEEIRQASHISILSEILTAASIVMAVLLVKRLTAYQMQASRGGVLSEVFE